MKAIIIFLLMLEPASSESSSGWVVSSNIVATATLYKSQIKIKVVEGKTVLFTESIKPTRKATSIYYFGLCELGGKIQPDVIAYARYKNNQQYSGTVHNAWRINVEKKRLEAVVTDGLRCINESYPGDGD
jgi:hypothetical protein